MGQLDLEVVTFCFQPKVDFLTGVGHSNTQKLYILKKSNDRAHYFVFKSEKNGEIWQKYVNIANFCPKFLILYELQISPKTIQQQLVPRLSYSESLIHISR